jgi:hypothetical protein
MAKKEKAVKTEPVTAELEVVQKAAPPALVEPNAEIVVRIEEAVESLSSFDDVKLPIVRLQDDGFEVREGEDPVKEFTGTIIFTKQSNAYYKKRYKAGDTSLPDCYSSDGRAPDRAVQEPVCDTCRECPLNQFGSDPQGEGKACKNTRPTFILVDNEEDPETLPIIPKVLRVSPTSLGLVRNYITNLAADYGSYFAVKTKFSTFKKEESQAYFNVKFQVAKRLTPQEKANVKLVRSKWLTYMQQGLFGVDEMDMEARDVTPPVEAPSGDGTKEVEF